MYIVHRTCTLYYIIQRMLHVHVHTNVVGHCWQPILWERELCHCTCMNYVYSQARNCAMVNYRTMCKDKVALFLSIGFLIGSFYSYMTSRILVALPIECKFHVSLKCCVHITTFTQLGTFVVRCIPLIEDPLVITLRMARGKVIGLSVCCRCCCR